MSPEDMAQERRDLVWEIGRLRADLQSERLQKEIFDRSVTELRRLVASLEIDVSARESELLSLRKSHDERLALVRQLERQVQELTDATDR